MVPLKNRNRKAYSFANINLLGKCNADCYFCLGKDIPSELVGKNQLSVHFTQWKNFKSFLTQCRDNDISKLYLTGQTADGLQYVYLDELIDYLQDKCGFSVGIRTNGYLALKRMTTIRKMKDEIGYSIHTLNCTNNNLIMGRRDLPEWNKIIPQSGDNVRVAIVLNRYNVLEFYSLCEYISQFPNVNYIQVRRVSTDTRMVFLNEDIDIFEKFYQCFISYNKPIREYYGAPIFKLFGKDIVFWRTVETSINSLNYFTDGTCSDEYFVVEGYLKNQDVNNAEGT
jgi:MoaA/NifB/PqqE/SkfB family radical SAM enzyme